MLWLLHSYFGTALLWTRVIKNWLLKEEKGARQSRLCIGKFFNELASRSFVAIGQYCVHVLDKAVTLEQQIFWGWCCFSEGTRLYKNILPAGHWQGRHCLKPGVFHIQTIIHPLSGLAYPLYASQLELTQAHIRHEEVHMPGQVTS